MAVNLAQIKDLLLPGLRDVTGQYDMIPRQWDKVFKKTTSKMALERTASMRYLGLAALKNEGAQTSFDNGAGERFIYNQEHIEIALGYAITRKAIDDNLYKSQFTPTNLGLNKSFAQTKELYAADVFNTATTYNAAIGGDGKALCATDHPIDGTTVANKPTTAETNLNETSLLNAMVSIRQNFRDNAGLRIFARGEKLVIPSALEPVALRLLRSELRPGTADNDINALKSAHGGISDFVTMDFLSSNYAWFLLTNIDGLIYMERRPYETDMQVDFLTDNLLVKAYERYSFGYYDWRAIWGTFPTS